MTIRLFLVLLYATLALIFFLMATATDDPKKKQTRLLYSIWFMLAELILKIGAIAHHTGAYPLWNNK